MNNETIMNSALVSTEELWRLRRVDFHTLHIAYTEVGAQGFPFGCTPFAQEFFSRSVV